MFTRYANFMWLFDSGATVYEHYWALVKRALFEFDHTYAFWRTRRLKWAEFKAYRALQGEIALRDAKDGDVINQVLLDIDKVDIDNYAKKLK